MIDYPEINESEIILNSSKEKEKEEILELIIVTDDGSKAYQFSFRLVDNEERFTCHLCDVVIIGQDNVKPHIESSKHQTNLKNSKPSKSLFTRFVNNSPTTSKETQKQTVRLQSKINKCKSSLIGLEYLIELTEYNKEPHYICMLCYKKGDPRVVMSHLQSFNHRFKYLSIFFPSVYKKIGRIFPRTKGSKKCQTVQFISKKIEEHYGRLTPLSLPKRLFELNKEEYAKKIINNPHLRETENLTFEEFVDNDMLLKHFQENTPSDNKRPQEKVNQRKFHSDTMKTYNQDSPNRTEKGNKITDLRTSPISSLSSISSNDSYHYRSRTRSRSRSYSRSPPRYKRYYRNERSYSRRSLSRSPKRSRSRYSKSPIGSKYKRSPVSSSRRTISPKYNPNKNIEDLNNMNEKMRWNKYRREIDIIVKDMLIMLKYYEKNPEKHPTYTVEWKKFWNRRYNELKLEGKDPSKHDFKSEWIQFWNKRMLHMYDSELKTKKEDLKRKLDLTIEERTNVRIQSTNHDDDNDVIIISPPTNRKSNTLIKSDYNSKRPLSPWEENEKSSKKYRKDNSPLGRYLQKRDRINLKNQRRPFLKEYNSKKNDEITVVVTLRQLTAIENQLGSMGPKINTLLSTALSLEKTCSKSSLKLLSDSSNIVFFETIKEKLIGQLIAGIVERHLVAATKSAIHSLDEILSMAEAMGKEATKAVIPKTTSNSKQSMDQEEMGPEDDFSFIHSSLSVIEESIIVEGVGPIEKEVLAQHIASALVSTGQADISQESLEKLVQLIVGNKIIEKPKPKPNTSEKIITSVSKTIPIEDDYKLALEKMNSPTNNENLTEAEIVILLNKFKDMSQENQHKLKQTLKTIETNDVVKINNLRTVIEDTPINYNFRENVAHDAEMSTSGRLSPFSLRHGGANPSPSKRNSNKSQKITFDDSEDEYSYDDIYTAASKNIEEIPTKIKDTKEKKKLKGKNEEMKLSVDKKAQMEKEKSKNALTKKLNEDPTAVLKETKEMIANIMGQLPVKYSQKQNLPSPKKDVKIPNIIESTIPSISEQQPYQTNVYQNNPNPPVYSQPVVNDQYATYPTTNYQYQGYVDQTQSYATNTYDYNNYYNMHPNTQQPQNPPVHQQYTDPSYNFNYSYPTDPNTSNYYQYQPNPGFY